VMLLVVVVLAAVCYQLKAETKALLLLWYFPQFHSQKETGYCCFCGIFV
jgi:hypothetical protein